MTHPKFIEALRDPRCYPHACDGIEVLETHISWVVLTGQYAYKIKKPVELGFLDYGTLARRKFFCEEELRLNRRLAPHLYLDVVAITGSEDTPIMGGTTQAFEYAVKMRQFPQDRLLSRMAEQEQLSAGVVDEIAHTVARFHQAIDVADPDTSLGEPATVLAAMRYNFTAIHERVSDEPLLQTLSALEAWTLDSHEQLHATIHKRKRQGYVRECHGDMHLGNIALIDGEVTVFDGIEFNEDYRWIHVMSELAFLLMDLDDRGLHTLAHRALNLYLQDTGDYEGLVLLHFFQVYRALVRAKVEAIRASQDDLSSDEREGHIEHCRHYTDLATSYTVVPHSALLITHGVSGTGKSVLSGALAEQSGAIWLRSDIERKRLHGLAPRARTDSGIEQGVYGTDATAATYGRLLALSEIILRAQFTVIVDATFLDPLQRRAFAQLAKRLGVRFLILDARASRDTLQTRVQSRRARDRDASDATLEVLHYQLARDTGLSSQERDHALIIDTEHALPLDDIRRAANI